MAIGAPWQIHSVLERSHANGPGTRFVIWTQGCALACPGCFNPETHSGDGGRVYTAAELAGTVLQAGGIDGVTITGGEPLQQPEALADFCELVSGHLGVVILTGFTRREIESDLARARAVARADMVIAGRYNVGRHLGEGLRGSSNKQYWARTGRYTPADFTTIPEIEMILAPDGTLTITGMPT